LHQTKLTQVWSARAVYIDRIAAGIVEASLRIVDQAFGTQFLFGNSVNALDVGVALILHGVAAISLRTRRGRGVLWQGHLLPSAIQVAVEQLVGESLILIERWKATNAFKIS